MGNIRLIALLCGFLWLTLLGMHAVPALLPQFVELKVVETEPGLRGDTASGGTKPAKLETGAVVQVPLFVEQGDVLKVDRREHKYLTRV